MLVYLIVGISGEWRVLCMNLYIPGIANYLTYYLFFSKFYLAPYYNQNFAKIQFYNHNNIRYGITCFFSIFFNYSISLFKNIYILSNQPFFYYSFFGFFYSIFYILCFCWLRFCYNYYFFYFVHVFVMSSSIFCSNISY